MIGKQLTYPTSELAPQFGCGARCTAVLDATTLESKISQLQVGVRLPAPEYVRRHFFRLVSPCFLAQ
jgi:hypothetical protein